MKGDGKQILSTAENNSENSNDLNTRKFEWISHCFSSEMHRDGKSISKNSNYNKKFQISTRF